MSASLSFELQEFEKNYFLSWEVLTQCQNTVTVILKVGNSVYFECKKSNSSISLQEIASDSKLYTSTAVPILTITVNESKLLKQSTSSGAITDQRARKIGYIYNFCIEDANDDDFNDVYVNIVGWSKRG